MRQNLRGKSNGDGMVEMRTSAVASAYHKQSFFLPNLSAIAPIQVPNNMLEPKPAINKRPI
jgi:hypothetical protein